LEAADYRLGGRKQEGCLPAVTYAGESPIAAPEALRRPGA